jgi:Zn-dependent metalloprotease
MDASGSNLTFKYGDPQHQLILMTDEDNNWNDLAQASGVDAHVYTGHVYDFMLNRYALNCPDNMGLAMHNLVEFPDLPNNAGYAQGCAIFGIPDQYHYSFAGFADVNAHEWGHGITEFASNLIPSKESGALGEAFASMFAATFKYLYLNDHINYWKIGKGYYRLDNSVCAVDMDDPHSQQKPNTYLNDQYWQDLTNCTPSSANDSCYVHTNCGVPNKMFTLLADGGLLNGITVQGIGMENAFRVMYETNRRRLWPSNATFWNARDGTIQAALLIDATTHTARNVADAWNAVNLCDTCQYVPGDFNGNGEARGSDITRLVSFLKGEVPPPPDSCHVPYQVRGRDWFYVTGDYNGDCQVNGADVTWGVAYYKLQKPEIRHCPHFSPSAP